MQELQDLSAGMTSSPSGLQCTEASLARNLFTAMPTEQVMPCCSATLARISAPMAAGGPSRRKAPDTSRNASSSDSGSTSGVIVRKMPMTSFDTAPYTPCRGGMMTACGHRFRARAMGMAERTP